MEFLKNIWNFLWGIISSIIELIFSVISVAISCVKSIFVIFVSLPNVLKVFLFAIVAVSVIYKFLSKGGSGDG